MPHSVRNRLKWSCSGLEFHMKEFGPLKDLEQKCDMSQILF